MTSHRPRRGALFRVYVILDAARPSVGWMFIIVGVLMALYTVVRICWSAWQGSGVGGPIEAKLGAIAAWSALAYYGTELLHDHLEDEFE
jgi:hypothetical protein